MPKNTDNNKVSKNTNNKVSKKLQNVVVDDVSDNDSNSISDVESDNESDNDDADDNEDDDNDDEDEDNNQLNEDIKKDKTKKLTHEELLDEINGMTESENILESEIIDLQTLLMTKIKERKALAKKKNKLLGLLQKAHNDGLNKARKEKKKRTNTSKSGILTEHPIPPILLKFLNLPENTVMMRPKVFSLLHNKFKELGLKKGQEAILDKKTAKLFGVEDGHVIRFQDFQKFLADIYEKAKVKQTEVTL